MLLYLSRILRIHFSRIFLFFDQILEGFSVIKCEEIENQKQQISTNPLN